MTTSPLRLPAQLHWLRTLAVWLGLVATSVAQTVPFLFDRPAPAPAMRLVWQTKPGVRYDLWQSPDLASWARVPGFPAAASGLSQEYPFTAGTRGFFRIVPIDEQPPVVADQFPTVDGFAVGRFADLVIRLEDPAGINPASIRLTVGNIGPLAVGAPGLTFANGTLSYDSGALALGDYSATVSATLVAADTLGNTLTHTWSFKLEPSPQIAANIFVFGSTPALASGQKLAGPAAAIAARFSPGAAKVPASSTPWSIESVTANSIVIAYTPGNAPAFSVGQLICNLAPAREDQVFYRRVLSVTDDTATSKLTIGTEEAALGSFVTAGGTTFSASSVVFEVDAGGALIPPPSLLGIQSLTFATDISLPRTGIDLSGSEFKLGSGGDFEATVRGVTYSQGSSPHWLDMTATELSWWFTPRLHLALELGFGGVKSFEAIASGDVSLNQALQADITLRGASTKTAIWQLAGPLRPRFLFLVGSIGPVPIYAVIVFDFSVQTEAKAEAILDLSLHYRQDFSARFGLTYENPTGLDWIKGFTASSPDLGGDADLAGKFSLELRLVPSVSLLVYNCAGFSASLEPYGRIEVKAGTGGYSGSIGAGVDFAIEPAGPMLDPFFPDDWRLAYRILEGEWPLTPQTLAFTTHPQSKTVAPGASTSFTCTVDSSSPAAFQWFHNGSPIPGQTNRTLFLPSVSSGYAGSYFVRATAGSATANSNTATLTVQIPTPANIDTDGDGLLDSVETNTGVWVSSTNTGTNPLKWDTDGDGLRDGVETHTGVFVSLTNTGTDPNKRDTDNDGVNDKTEIDAGTDPNVPPPVNMALIPAGNFQMGNSTNAAEGGTDELPPHTVYVSAFYMDRYEVPKQLWDDVRAWGLSNGYPDLPVGSGKEASHPVLNIAWYSMVKWCNARSQRDALTPVYYTDNAQTLIYKTGNWDLTTAQVRWNASGYRLPTEAEWEKAARGGTSGHRFPWSNVETITHSQANYYSSSSHSYDVSPTRGYHPTYAVNGTPYTSPVGSFAPNGFGLYEMAGNVWELCWDRYLPDYYNTSPSSDPQGPQPGSSRVYRGGGWTDGGGRYNRVAARFSLSPSATSTPGIGFRCVRK